MNVTTHSRGRRRAGTRKDWSTRWSPVLWMVGAVVGLTGVAMISNVAVSAIYQEWSETGPLLLSAAITIGAGAIAFRRFDPAGGLTNPQAFAAVGVAWFVMSAFGTLPYLLTGSMHSVTNAFFESASGFTATGSSVVSDPGMLSHGILFWRALTQWLGGMGVIVLSIALLPLLGMNAVQLARAESPGPMPERVTPRFQETAKRLWLLYAGFTLLQTLLLTVADMNLFEAVTHSFASLSGGGFGTNVASMAAFSAYSQWVVVVFMLVGGTSFALHYRALRKPLNYVRNWEFRLYMLVLAVFSGIVIVWTWGGSVEETVRDAVFTVSSILTTTGFATVDFGRWAPFLQALIIGLMFIGAMAGSTSGSVKVYRFEILYKQSRRYLRRLIDRRQVSVIRSGGTVVADHVVESVRIFTTLYLFAFMTGAALLGLIGVVAGAELDLDTIVSAVATSLGNVGPGVGLVGPSHNFLLVPALGKWLLASLMIVGRLEILPIVLLFTRDLWRR